eukprot:CAMPEP_0170826234 /NCGR_PEP_ID=MMETSP0733-20121128/46475_1 /TAXON_ID=186038 /ORGANISM="Fragilariopsis kerguelensis, Strain L26-C5" /LENGTH=124 /DNA_ID=CAMNT_0011190029 /DNA_START=83 /DNA_END=454 /DNA_ORIENTATION=-
MAYEDVNATKHIAPNTTKATKPSSSFSFGSTSSGPVPGTPERTLSRTIDAHRSSSSSAAVFFGGRRETSSHDASSCATLRFCNLPRSASWIKSIDSFTTILLQDIFVANADDLVVSSFLFPLVW